MLRAIANALLGLVGWRIVPRNIGRWSVRDGELHRRVRQIGWRLAPRSEWGLGDDCTEFDRFLARASRDGEAGQ